MLNRCFRGCRVGVLLAIIIVMSSPLSVNALPWIDESNQTTFSRASGKLTGGDTIEITNVNFYGPILKRLGKIASLGVGDGHYVALLDNGTLLTWGVNDDGQLGNGTRDSTTDKQAYDITNLIHNNNSDEIERVVAVAAGASSSFALTERGRVYWWGDGQLTPTKMLGMHGQTAESIKVDRSQGDTEAVIKTYGVNDKHERVNEQLFAWKSSDAKYISNIDDGGRGCQKESPCARGISGLRGKRIKDYDIAPFGGHVAILNDENALFIWNGEGTAQKANFSFNDERGLDFVAAGDTREGNTNQMYILASRSNLVFAWDGEISSQPGFPISSPIKQVMTDGYDGHYILTETGQIYMLYAGGKEYLPLDALPKGEIVQRMYVKPIDNDYAKGTVIGLTASGRIYETSTHDELNDVSRTRDITPELIYDTGEEGGQIDSISFGGSDVDADDIQYKDGDNSTVIVKVPGQVREGTVDVVERDIDGNQILLGSYTYDDPTPDPEPDTPSGGNEANNSGGESGNENLLPNPNKPSGESSTNTSSTNTSVNDNTLKDIKNALKGSLKTSEKASSSSLTTQKSSTGSQLLSNPNKATSSGSKITAPNTGI